jgi:hypothetical protein
MSVAKFFWTRRLQGALLIGFVQDAGEVCSRDVDRQGCAFIPPVNTLQEVRKCMKRG